MNPPLVGMKLECYVPYKFMILFRPDPTRLRRRGGRRRRLYRWEGCLRGGRMGAYPWPVHCTVSCNCCAVALRLPALAAVSSSLALLALCSIIFLIALHAPYRVPSVPCVRRQCAHFRLQSSVQTWTQPGNMTMASLLYGFSPFKSCRRHSNEGFFEALNICVPTSMIDGGLS